MNLRFSIVIPVLNLSVSLDLLLRCLEQLEFPRERFECIIVDDGSTDGTKAILESHQSGLNLTLIFNRVNQGRSQARNIGWQQARGEVVVFLDGDMLPEPQWLQHFDESIARHPEWDVISGGRYCIQAPYDAGLRHSLARLINVSPDELFASQVAEQFKTIYAAAALGQYPRPLLKKFELQLREVCRLLPENLLCAYSLVTSNVAVRRRRLAAAGGFDPFLRRCEDTDLGLRLWKSGCRFGFAEGARAYHLYDPRQPDRQMTLAEDLALFYRHPYSLIVMMHVWCTFNAVGATGQGVLAGGLTLLGQMGQVPIRADLIQLLTGLAQHGAVLFDQLDFGANSHPREFMVDYLAEVSGLSPARIEGYLNSALKQGMFAIERQGKIYLDFYHTSNWLRYHTRYEEDRLRLNSYGRTTKTPYFRTGSRDDLAALSYSGTYELHLPTELLESDSEGTLNIALPAENEYQSDVRITEVFPDGLRDYADYSKSMMLGIPLNHCRRLNGRIGYSFQCRVREVATAPNAGNLPAGAAELAVHLPPTLNAEYLAKARKLLDRMEIEPGAEAYPMALSIYSWMLDHTSFYETPLADFFCLDTGFGSSVHQSRLFINLCRLMKIPARERCGGVLFKAAGGQSHVIETRVRGLSPFTHSWAEFHSPPHGWVPVDFIGWRYGERCVRTHNVTDAHLRAELANETASYDRYYFGNLDPFRIHTGAAVNAIPLASFRSAGGKPPAGSQQRLAAIRHLLRCEIVASTVPLASPATGLSTIGASG